MCGSDYLLFWAFQSLVTAFFLTNRHRSIFFQQSCEARTVVFICYPQGSLVQPIDFVIHLSATKHPNQRAVLELASHKMLSSKVSIYQYLDMKISVTNSFLPAILTNIADLIFEAKISVNWNSYNRFSSFELVTAQLPAYIYADLLICSFTKYHGERTLHEGYFGGGPNTAIPHEKDTKYRNTAQKIAKYRKH